MKTKNDLSECYEEITPNESEAINGGFIALSILAGVAAVCALAYYSGYAVGKIMCEE